MSIERELIVKEKSHAFNKDVYLLGTINGKKQWLEAASWDCSWYWGFGYVEEYTIHCAPSKSRDIVSHSHIKRDGEAIYKFYERFESVTFTEKEQWELGELFTQFYLLKEMAEFASRENPKCNVANTLVEHEPMKDLNEKINKVMLPKIFNRIYEILSPN